MISNTSNLSKVHKFYLTSELISTSGQPSESQLQQIAECDFEVLINLGMLNDPRYSLPDEKGLVESLGLIYVHIPIEFDSPTESDLEKFLKTLDMYSGKKIWIHCAANIRVSAFIGLYHIIRCGWTPYRAFEQMRSIWTPDQVWTKFITAVLKKQKPLNTEEETNLTKRTIQIVH